MFVFLWKTSSGLVYRPKRFRDYHLLAEALGVSLTVAQSRPQSRDLKWFGKASRFSPMDSGVKIFLHAAHTSFQHSQSTATYAACARTTISKSCSTFSFHSLLCKVQLLRQCQLAVYSWRSYFHLVVLLSGEGRPSSSIDVLHALSPINWRIIFTMETVLREAKLFTFYATVPIPVYKQEQV